MMDGNKLRWTIPLASLLTTFHIEAKAVDIEQIGQRNEILTPSDADNRLVQMAFRDFDSKRFDASDKEFTMAIARWEKLNRPRDELVSLLKARANVRLDNKQFDLAIGDYDTSLDLMKDDGEDTKGLGRYPEYPVSV